MIIQAEVINTTITKRITSISEIIMKVLAFYLDRVKSLASAIEHKKQKILYVATTSKYKNT